MSNIKSQNQLIRIVERKERETESTIQLIEYEIQETLFHRY